MFPLKTALFGIEPGLQGLVTKSSFHCATKIHAVMWSEVIVLITEKEVIFDIRIHAKFPN